MNLTIDQALQQAVTAHKAGKLQDAERLYRAILNTQSNHPDANHNLGLLVVSVSKAEAALPLFKTALDANPKIDQFWLSYIGALIKTEKFDHAKHVLEQAKKQGIDRDRLNSLEAQLSPSAQKTPDNVGLSPPQELLKSLLGHYQNERFAEAEKLSMEVAQDYPKHPFAWKVLGAVLGATGRKPEAVYANQTAIALSPRDAAAHYNLGITLQELGRLDEAEASYTQAIVLKADYAEAHSNLGVTLQELGRLDEAEASYIKAIALRPDYVDAHNNLGNTLKELGRLEEALTSYKKAMALKPDYAKARSNLGAMLQELGRLEEAVTSCAEAITLKPDFTEAYVNLGVATKNVRFNSSNSKLYTPLTQLLTAGNFTRPKDVAGSILSLLKHDVQIKDLLLGKNVSVGLNEVTSIIRSLDKLPLLHHLMRVCPLPDLQFEALFVKMRRFLLKNLDKVEVSPDLIYFLSTLSIHCFINEYVYIEGDEETHLIGKIQAEIDRTLAQSEQPEAIKVLCLASYRSLHQYNWCQKLETLDNLKEVKKRLIEEPLLEKIIAKDIPVLGEISDDVSLRVRKQYEENPYPRWVKLGVSIKAKPIVAVCDELKLQLHSENIKNVTAPAILIAGCGTGQHSIATASRFYNCHVTAVDLSRTSLAYAKRKSNDLGFTNIDYLQADILHLHQMDKKFDIIESAGVLHHMEAPMAGWKVLVDLLKPGGLMKIGLYSGLARQHIVEIRREIKALGVGTSEADIRNFRQSLTESHDNNHQLLITSSDFFSLSTIRDLIFHVQEHRFTLPQVKNCLDELELKFCGFENKDAISNFEEFHGGKVDICDLGLWHQLEQSHPNTFVAMYQFWCQKL